jgi:TIR domain
LSYLLPKKTAGYLRRLAAEYKLDNKILEHEIITQGRLKIIEETGYDNWNGGINGHTVRIYLPFETLGKIRIKNQNTIQNAILDDLRELKNAGDIEDEYFEALTFLDMNDENDPHFQTAIPFSAKPQLDPDTLSIWKPEMIRLFISHRDIHKAKANELAAALEKFGIYSFVAHDSIGVSKEWTKEILNGLETMEIMLAFVTDGFSQSPYTNQEIGYALGSNKPVISLKLGKEAPSGFININQAMRGDIDNLQQSAQELYSLIAKEVGKKERLDEALITAFILSKDWFDTKESFIRMEGSVTKLADAQLQRIIDAYYKNDQLHGCMYICNHYHRLRKYLEKATDKEFKIESRKINEIKPKKANIIDLDEDVPF